MYILLLDQMFLKEHNFEGNVWGLGKLFELLLILLGYLAHTHYPLQRHRRLGFQSPILHRWATMCVLY